MNGGELIESYFISALGGEYLQHTRVSLLKTAFSRGWHDLFPLTQTRSLWMA